MSALLTRNRLIGLGLAALIVVLDQWVKALVTGPLNLRNQPGGIIELLPFFRLNWTQNYGVSLGMLTATSMEMRWLLVAVTAGIALVVLVWLLRERKLVDIAALALILGGAIGNIYDRFFLGYVIDYADFHLGGWTPFVFNIADAAITCGVVIILARSLFLREKQPDRGTDAGSEPADQAMETN